MYKTKQMNKNEKRGFIVAITIWIVSMVYFFIEKWRQ